MLKVEEGRNASEKKAMKIDGEVMRFCGNLINDTCVTPACHHYDSVNHIILLCNYCYLNTVIVVSNAHTLMAMCIGVVR